MLDLSPQQYGNAYDPASEQPDVPAEFDEEFAADWNVAWLFGQSTAGENARMEALVDAIKQNTGKDIWSSVEAPIIQLPHTPQPLERPVEAMLPQINAAAAKLGQPELSPDQLQQNAVAKTKAAVSTEAALGDREQTLGGHIGAFLGGAIPQALDPMNLVAISAGPEGEGAGVLAAALRWGAVAGISQAGIEGAGAPYREEVEPGYEQQNALPNVLEATVAGGVLGGSFKGLGNLWTRLKTGAWPTSVRDAGNVVESEANIASSNVYPGVEGEVAHRQALSAAIDSILGGKPVTADGITPELEAQARALPILQTRAMVAKLAEEAQAAGRETAEVQPQLPFEATAALERLRASSEVLGSGVQQIAQRAGYAMPGEEAAAVAARLTKASPEEADSALRDLQVNPRQVAQWAKGPAEPQRSPLVSPALEGPQVPVPPINESTLASPDFNAALRADIDRERALGDVQIPVDVDKDGNAIMRSVDGAMSEVEGYKGAAEQIAACAAPEPAEPEAEAA